MTWGSQLFSWLPPFWTRGIWLTDLASPVDDDEVVAVGMHLCKTQSHAASCR